MDKLKPIIAHKFWIFFGLTLLLPTIGWWSASGALQQQFTSRKSSLESTFGQIPTGQGTPNDKWIKGASDEAAKREEANRASHQRLWDRQQSLLAWPPSIAKVMKSCPYRGQITQGDNMDMALDVPDLYRESYVVELEKLWQVVEPLGYQNGPQKVEFKQETLPSVDEKKWAEMPPSWEEMWNAQEDSWLVTELLQAIQRVNEPTSNRADSYIKKIQTIELAGGNRAALTSGGGKQTGNKPAGPLGNLGIGATSAEGSAGDFKLSDEFGTPTAKDAQAAPATTPVVGAKPSATAPSSRYVDDGPKFRTRAFKLTVDMDHRRLPHLLVELTNSNWPVEIVRVNQVARSENANSGEDEEDEPNDKREISKSALTGPHMATVIVAGLFTLYNPPAVPETPAGEQPAAGAQPAPAAQPATEGTVPATGAAPAGTAAPANNAETPTGPTTNGNSAAPATSPATPAAGATAAPENNAPK